MDDKDAVVICHERFFLLLIILHQRRLVFVIVGDIGYPVALSASDTCAFTTIILHALIQFLKPNIFVLIGQFVNILIFCCFWWPNCIIETGFRFLNLRHLELRGTLIVQIKILLLVITSQLFLAFVKLVEDVESAVPEFLEGLSSTLGTFIVLFQLYLPF